MSAFKKAVKTKLKARVALMGPSGGGKTFTGLSIAKGLLPEGGKIAVIDTERGSASKYSDLFNFDVLELTSFEPQKYIEAINESAKGGYPVLMIDSMSHAWFGSGGLLEQVDNAAKRSQSGNSFAAWKTITPIQNQFIDTILSYPGHVIVTLRVKMDYVVEKDEKTGKQTPRKIGLAPVQRDGLEYEFDLIGDINIDHELVVSKTRCHLLADRVIMKAGEDVGKILLGWLDDGKEKATAAIAYVREECDNATDLEALRIFKEECRTAGGLYWTEDAKAIIQARADKLNPANKAALQPVIA